MDKEKSKFSWFYFTIIVLVGIIGLDTYVLNNQIKHKLQHMLKQSDSRLVSTIPKTENKKDVAESNENESPDEENEETETDEFPQEKKLEIHGLGEFSQEDLEVIKSGVEEYYDLTCVFGQTENTAGSFYVDGSNILIANKVLALADGKPGFHMYITNEPLINNDPDNLISGHSYQNNRPSVVSTFQSKKNGHYSKNSVVHTARHELGHNFGLDHCGDKNCLMVEKGLGTLLLCEQCRRKIEGRMK